MLIKPLTHCLILIGSVCCCTALSAQSALKKERFVALGSYNHTFGLPFRNPFKGPYSPGVSLEYNVPLKKRKHTLWFQSVGLGYYYHQHLNHGIAAGTGTNHRYHIGSGWLLGLGLQASALYTYDAKVLYQVDETGGVARADGSGQLSFVGSFHLMTGYSLRQSLRVPADVFTQYQWGVQAPFSAVLPIIPHNTLKFGINYYFLDHKKSR